MFIIGIPLYIFFTFSPYCKLIRNRRLFGTLEYRNSIFSIFRCVSKRERLFIFNSVLFSAVDLLLEHGFVLALVVLDVPFGMKNGSLKTLVVMVPEVCYP